MRGRQEILFPPRSGRRWGRHGAAADAAVLDPVHGHQHGVEEVAAVEDQRLAQRALDGVEVGAAEFLPLGDDAPARRRPPARAAWLAAKCRPGAPSMMRAAPRPWPPGRRRARWRRGAVSSSTITRLGASRMSSVLGLKARPQSAKRAARRDPARSAPMILSTSTCFWRSLTASTACSTRRSMPFSCAGVDQRLHVLGEARAAVAAARVEELRADARVAADALAHQLDVGAQLARPAAPARS